MGALTLEQPETNREAIVLLERMIDPAAEAVS